MPAPEPLTVLLASDRAEEIKLLTIALRSAYPGCRVEAVYSEEEALEWASKGDWHILLADERLPPRGSLEALPELRRRAATAAIIVLTDTSEPSTSLQLARDGADCILFRKSAGFLAELMVMVREVLEKRDLRVQRDLIQGRYLRLVEAVGDLVYELDAEGRFRFLSQSVLTMLGYSPQELLGAHYSTIVLPPDRPVAHQRLNERRTGSRATTNLRVRLSPKRPETTEAGATTVEISARGLYDRANRFVGTVGFARPAAAPRARPSEDLDTAPCPSPAVEDVAAPAAHEAARARDEATPDVAPLGDRDPLVDAPRRKPAPGTIPTEPPPATAPVAASRERRRSPRFDLPIETKLTHEGTTWTGSVANISLSGVALELEGLIPAQEGWTIHLGLISTIAVLHLQGTVRATRDLDRRRVGARVFPGTVIIVEFTDMRRDERMVLGSLLEGLQDRSITASLTVLLQPSGPEDVMVEATAELIGPAPRIPLEAFPPDSEDLSDDDHRLGTRVSFVMPVRLRIEGLGEPSPPLEGRTLNLSLTGACLRLGPDLDLRGQRLDLEFAIPPTASGPAAQPATAEVVCRLRAEVVWMEPEAGMVRAGVRFLHLDDEGEQRVRELVAGLLTHPLRIHGSDGTSTLISSFMACGDPRGRPLAVVYDRPRKPLPPGAPLAIIAPDFGETKRDYVFLAYALARNGFHVLRFDYTDHVGESAGEMIHSTLSGMQRDLAALVRFAANSWPASAIVVIAAGLAGRVALKAAAELAPVRLLILLASVLDVRTALREIHAEDVVGGHPPEGPGAQAGLVNVFGFNIDARRWLGDLVPGDYADLASAVRDARRVATPTVLFAAEQDPRTPFAAVKEIQSALGPHAQQTYVLPDPRHRLHDDAKKDRALYRQVVVESLRHCYPLSSPDELQPPSLREVERQRRVEWDRLRARPGRSPCQSVDLLAGAREADPSRGEFADHWRLLDDVYRLSSLGEEAERILDAACGTAEFGKVLLINRAYHRVNAPPDSERSLLYVGGATDPATALRAGASLGTIMADLQDAVGRTARPDRSLRLLVGVMSQHRPLPWKDHTFDRVVSFFTLNALLDPLSGIRDLVRVLAPGGRLVLASLRPHADFTRLYRNLAADESRPEPWPGAKRLLAAWGAIAEAERNGALQFFDRRELVALLKLTGAANARLYPALANQAYLAVAERPGRRSAAAFS